MFQRAETIVRFSRSVVGLFLISHAQRRKITGATPYGPTSEEVAAILSGNSFDLEPQMVKQREQLSAALDDVIDLARSVPEHALGRLRRVFGLMDMDVFIIALLLGPELDPDIERLNAYAMDDFSKKRCDVGFVARAFAAGNQETEDLVLTRLADHNPLRRFGIVVMTAANDSVPTNLRTVRLSDRIVEALRDHEGIDETVRGVCRISPTPPQLTDLVFDPDIIARVSRGLGLATDLTLRRPARLLLCGPEGIGRGLLVEALMGQQQRRSVRIDLAALIAEGGRLVERCNAALREAALRDAVAIIDGGSTVKDDMPRALGDALADACSVLAVPIVFTLVSRPAWLAAAVPDLVELEVAPPTFAQRRELWKRALPGDIANSDDLDVVAGRYAFVGAAIARASRRAAATARLRDPALMRVSLEDLSDASRLTFSHRLGAMAQRIPTGFKWSDLVLPPDTMEAVLEVVRFARHRPFLLEEWGFSAKLPYGRGISAIMAGPPGTGKTMVAQLLASELGYDLYRIDLSQVVNKYIGETEKNLARIFEEAESSHAVLFFDEADSLFAKRTEVKSSNDRYANLEVNYLLQRMETYDGITLLATNLEQGLDEAFKRRVRFSVQFELPEEAERKRLWISMFPPKVPIDADIDWDKIANRFVMAGGYIKKAALRAALIAVSAQRSISTDDIYEAARMEYREMGRIV
jgi:hypothetical protein